NMVEVSSNSVTEVLLPSMGEGIAEATLVKWLKKPGDLVQKDEPLLEVSTDKVDTEIPSPSTGTLLETTVTEGTTVEVNSTIAWIGPKGSSVPKKPSNHLSPKPIAASGGRDASPVSPGATSDGAPQQVQARSNNGGAKGASLNEPVFRGSITQKTSPLVRKMARDLGIDPRRIPGTGHLGRVTKDDVTAFSLSPAALSLFSGSEAITEAAAAIPILAGVTTSIKDGVEILEGVPVRRVKMSKIRRIIAEHMVSSVRVSPHVTTTFEIDLEKVVAMRASCKAEFARREGFNLTFTPILIKAAVDAIKLHPVVNVSVDGDEILWKDHINIGCAVALGAEGGGGLIVPVIKNAQTMNVTEIARKLNDLASRARSKKLTADEVVGGTFSITNPGGWGSITSNPIINQPQVAMLGIGAIVKRAVVVANDQIVVRPMMMASLTFDHRAIDGEGGAAWLATFKKILESWTEQA
ncbi:MAG: dihydrolipoamide acetyltransferase family protein, partial [Proteobacteria bacterium]|nr:dihydrolipoamide acetyltransferase family protein [Pseudomonadota bacterium]